MYSWYRMLEEYGYSHVTNDSDKRMTMKIRLFLQSIMIMLVCFRVSASTQASTERVLVQALFLDKAMISIDGRSHLLVVGQPNPEGVVLVSASNDGAVIRINGKQGSFPLSSEVGTSFLTDAEVVEELFPDEMGMYSTTGSINEQPVEFVVDTGASLIAMNRQQARRLGIDFRLTGTLGQVTTASGIARVYQVRLKTVRLGEIVLRNVDAVVMNETQPSSVLLGMSFLRNVKMESNGRVMELRLLP